LAPISFIVFTWAYNKPDDPPVSMPPIESVIINITRQITTTKVVTENNFNLGQNVNLSIVIKGSFLGSSPPYLSGLCPSKIPKKKKNYEKKTILFWFI
jgi:hypothetical protein